MTFYNNSPINTTIFFFFFLSIYFVRYFPDITRGRRTRIPIAQKDFIEALIITLCFDAGCGNISDIVKHDISFN